MDDLPLIFRPMRPADIEAIMGIEEQVFPLPWPRVAYEDELRRNPRSSYYVLELADDNALGEKPQLLGYGGFWVLHDEAHLMTIAVAPGWQGRGLGEWLLLLLLEAMERRGARVATLEVRAGNRRAQALYRRLGFRVVGRRPKYYADSQEDALIMTTPALSSRHMMTLRRGRQAATRERLRQWLLADHQ